MHHVYIHGHHGKSLLGDPGVMVYDFDVFVLCLVSYVLIFCPFFVSLHCSSLCSPLCLFPYLLALVSLCLSVLFPPCFLLCAFPSLSHLSSSLLSPHLFLVPCVCVLKPWFPMYSASVHCWCLCDVSFEFLVFPLRSPVSSQFLYVLNFDLVSGFGF